MSHTPGPAPSAHTDPPTRPIRFLHRGRTLQIQGPAPTTTVLSWLREQAHCTGTKEGCNEGDCGACMVAVAELDPHGRPILRNLNACLMFLPTLDGKALWTVEDLQSPCGGTLHPVQQALVDHHASQCGFCTPGFAVTMWTQWQNHQDGGPCSGQAPPTRQDWADALAGNLCRCTGYRPILDAAQDCMEQALPNAAIDWAQLGSQLQSVHPASSLAYRAHDPALGADRRFFAPRSSDELADMLVTHPSARILGGATDIALWTNKGHRDVGDLIFTGSALDLHAIAEDAGTLRIGAAATLEAAWSTLARHWPTLGDLWRRFASAPVRHAGTLSGNLANGSPIGDGAPVLMAMDAQLVLRQGPRRRRVALESFYLGYQRNALEASEFIEWIEVPTPRAGHLLRAWKISKRYDSDISAVCAGFGLHHREGVLQRAVLAFGGMAATVRRAAHAEQALLDRGWNEAGIQAAQDALAQDFQPLSDLRATADYRLQASRALLERLWWSVGPNLRHGGASAPASVPLEVWR